MKQGEVIVLGSGTSNGVPSLGKKYSKEFLENPKNHRTRSSILIKGPEGNVLVDCAPEMRFQLLRENIMNIAGVVITHTHADHVMGMDDLRSFCIATKEPVAVYTSPKYQQDIRRIFKYAFEEVPPGVFVPRFDLRDLPNELELAGLKIQIMWVKHGPLPVAALRINDFAYVTDVSEIPETAWEKLQNLDALILDAVRFKPHPNHYHLAKSIEVAQALNPRQTYFTHLCDEFDHDKIEPTLPPRIALAYDGLRIPI